MLKLQLIDTPEINIKLSSLPVTVGRDEGNSLSVDSLCVSDFHAEIHRDELGLYIIDLLSAGGTFVNEHRVAAKCRLNPWDVIRLGTVKLEINDPNVCRPDSWALRTESDLLASQFYTLADKTIVGRDPDCDLTIDWHLLSRHHAEIYVEGDRLRIVDLNSRNGTYLNGKKISEGLAKPRDELRFDQQTFVVVGPPKIIVSEDHDQDLTGMRDSIPRHMVADGKMDTTVSTRYSSAVGDLLPNAALVFTSGDLVDTRFSLDKSRVTIGRSVENDLVIMDPEASKKHAVIQLVEEHWLLKDNNSSNGVVVNGIVETARVLKSGDRIKIGTTELLFQFEKNIFHEDDTILC